MKKLFYFLVFLVLPIAVFAQDNSEDDMISAERPGVTNPPAVVSPKKLQIESGFNFESDKLKDTDFRTDNYLYPTTLIRYGLMKNVELRLQVDVAGVSTSFAGKQLSSISGLNPIIVGAKFYLCEQKKSRPEMAFVFGLTLPYFGRDEFRPLYPAPSLAFYFQNTFSKRTVLGYNVGMTWNGIDANPVSFAAISPSYNFTKKLSGFIELYSYFSKGTVPDFRFDGGFAYIALPNLQLDISGGPGIAGPTSNYFIGAGISLRLPK